jgi:hypothetical protein
MLKVTTEVPVPTPPPHKVKKAGNNFQDKSFKKIEDLLPWGFLKVLSSIQHIKPSLQCPPDIMRNLLTNTGKNKAGR